MSIENLLQPGTIIDGRYEIIGRIGDGGMGTVFSCRELELDRTVAVKFLHSELLDEESQSRFQLEGKILSELNHPNILKVFRFGVLTIADSQGESSSQLPYLAMEYLTGTTLRKVLDERVRLPPHMCAAIAKEVCSGLYAAHNPGFVHRDIKPGNLMLTGELNSDRDIRVKILDFGLASTRTTVQHHTGTGALVGTVSYMSPEQCLGKKADIRSDVYSLGCTLYEMLTGVVPHDADNPIGLMHKHANEIPIAASELRKDIPAGFDRVLFKAMAKEPGMRYQSMNEFEDDLKRIIDGQSELIEGCTRQEASKKFGRTGGVVPVALLLTLLLTIGLLAGAYFTWRNKEQKLEFESMTVPQSLRIQLKKFENMPPGHEKNKLAVEILASHSVSALNSNELIPLGTGAATYLRHLSDFRSAMVAIDRILPLLKNDKHAQAIMNLEQGETFVASGDFARAEKAYLSALQYCHGKERLLECVVHKRIGRLLLCRKRTALAAEELKKCETVPGWRRFIAPELGELYYQCGRLTDEDAVYADAFADMEEPSALRVFNEIAFYIHEKPRGEDCRRWERLRAVLDPVFPMLAARAAIMEANSLLLSGHARQAVDEMRSRVPREQLKDPRVASEYHYLMGCSLFEIHELAQANLELLKALEFHRDTPQRASILCRLGESFQGLGEEASRKDYFSQLEGYLEKNVCRMKSEDVLTMYVEMAKVLPSAVEGAAVFDRCVTTLDKQNASPLLIVRAARLQSTYLYRTGDYRKCAETLRKALVRAGNNGFAKSLDEMVDADRCLITTLIRMGCYSEAAQVQQSNQALHKRTFVRLLIDATDGRSPQESTKILARALTLVSPDTLDYIDVKIAQAQLMESEARPEEAIGIVEELLPQLDKVEIVRMRGADLVYRAEVTIGKALLYSQRASRSLEHFERAAKAAHYNNRLDQRACYHYAAHACEVMNQYQRASQFLRKARALSPPDDLVQEINEVRLYTRCGKRKEGLAALNRLFQKQVRNGFVDHLAAIILRDLYEFDPVEGRRYAREALAKYRKGLSSEDIVLEAKRILKGTELHQSTQRSTSG